MDLANIPGVLNAETRRKLAVAALLFAVSVPVAAILMTAGVSARLVLPCTVAVGIFMPCLLLSWFKDHNVSIQGKQLYLFEVKKNGIENQPLRRFEGIAKSLLDRIIAFLLILILGPVLLIFSLLIAISSKGPIVFRHLRVGKGGKTFMLLKFRTTLVDIEPDQLKFASKPDIRITRLGAFLRRYNLDELPQLFNVLRGEMSLVGPRPMLLSAQHLKQDFRRLLSVKPGITGWASLKYPSVNTEDEMREVFEADLYYVNHWSLLLDIKILIKYFRMKIADLSNA